MLSKEENERVTRVGPDTPQGQTMRRCWIPALLSWELPEPDCPPVRVKLLGEALVAFKDTEGRIGLLEELCPQCGLRCVYHGWKFDVEGHCVDMMNEPAENDFKHKIRTQAYPTVEAGGIIWAYMGPPEHRPPEPNFLWTQAPETHRHVTKVIQECNWLQALEGGIDTSHAPILHRSISSRASQPGIDPNSAWAAQWRAQARTRCHRLWLSLRQGSNARRGWLPHSCLPLRAALSSTSTIDDHRRTRFHRRSHLGADGRWQYHDLQLATYTQRGTAHRRRPA